MRQPKQCAAAGGLTICLAAGSAFAATGPSSSQSPYVVPTAPGIAVTSILTVGDAVGGYAMVGIPDGLGAYDNGDDTFTVLMNHELPPAVGDVRAHGARGAFVSEWVVRKSDFGVVSGRDLATSHLVWNGSSYVAATGPANAFGRLCSADLPAVSAFFNSASGLGTQDRLFMNGEEVGAEGRGYAFVATGASKGVAYELPALGKFSWENSVANPLSGDKTVVIGLDDSTPGQVYVYVGDKTNTGNIVDRAGLTNGALFGVKTPQAIEASPINGAFTLEPVNAFQAGSALQTQSNTLAVTNFARPEDGHWADADTFYFVTTGADPDGSGPTGGPIPTQSGRLYKLDFDANFSAGQVSMVLDAASLVGTDGATARAFDNMVVADDGLIYIQEDPGNTSYIAKTWQYNPATGATVQVLESDRSRFITGGANYLGTQDEESSGVIDITAVLGRNDGLQYFLGDMQAHYPNGPTLIEGGQLYVFSAAVPEPTSAVLVALAGVVAAGAARQR
ncbi:MAG: alkaline phosphatase PhoX [Lacipirellulaceae bacterium]